MAVKQYPYYIKGNKFAIVEKDTEFDNDVNSKDYGPGSARSQWKSPKTSVTDGIELQYVYSPEYRINDIDHTNNITSLTEDGYGKIRLTLEGSVSPALSKGDYIVIDGHKNFNGPHKVDQDASSTSVFLTTKYNGGVQNFTGTLPFIYEDVSYLSDEDSQIDLPEYLTNALVYYVKAKLAEDMRDMDGREYFLREFKRILEKHNNTRVAGVRRMATGVHSIR